MSPLTRRLFDAARVVTPKPLRHWVEAMSAESAHAPDDACALRIAAGAVFVAARLRFADRAFAPVAVRVLLTAAAAGWAVLNLGMAGRLDESGASLGAMLGYGAGGIYAAGAVMLAAAGLRMATNFMIPLAVLWAGCAAAAILLLDGAPHGRIYQALAAEELLAILAALSLAAWAQARGSALPR